MSNYRPYTGGNQGQGFIQDSFSSDTGATKKITNHTLRPVTIKQLLSIPRTNSDGDYKIDGHDLGQITLIAVVRVFVRQATQHIYHIEDGTGEIDGKRFTVDDEDPAEYDNIVEGTYVRIVGNLKEYQQRLSVNVHSIRPIKDKNEITYHLLEVIYTHVNFTRSKIGGTNMNNMGMMMPTSQNNFNNHSSAGVDGLSVKTGDLPQKIAEMFQNRPNKDVSVHRRDIISKFAPVVGSAEAVNNVVESMIQNGFVYTVEDDDHLQFTY